MKFPGFTFLLVHVTIVPGEGSWFSDFFYFQGLIKVGFFYTIFDVM